MIYKRKIAPIILNGDDFDGYETEDVEIDDDMILEIVHENEDTFCDIFDSQIEDKVEENKRW